MSEVLKFSSKDVKGWLEKETGSIFVPVHTKAQKLAAEMGNWLDSLSEVSKSLLENSGKEIEKRNMKTYRRARALNKLARLFVDRLNQISVPEKVSYDSFNKLVQDTQKAFLATEVDMRNWFPRISPFFIIDRRKFQAVFERSKGTLQNLVNFLGREYVKTKTLEDTFRLTESLQTLEQQLTTLEEQKMKVENESAIIIKEIAETQQQVEDLRSKGSIGQLNQTNAEIEALSAQVRETIHHLEKPFIKLQSLAVHGQGSGLTPEETGKLGQYVENCYEALATEHIDHPLLRQILQKLSQFMVEDKLKLKPEKTRKAQQLIGSILNNNSLADLQKRCAEALARKQQIVQSTELEATKGDLSKLKGQIENLERKKVSIEIDKNRVDQSIEEMKGKIANHKHTIEQNTLSFMNREIIIE